MNTKEMKSEDRILFIDPRCKINVMRSTVILGLALLANPFEHRIQATEALPKSTLQVLLAISNCLFIGLLLSSTLSGAGPTKKEMDWILPRIQHTQNNLFLESAILQAKKESREVKRYDDNHPMNDRDLDFTEAPAMLRLAEILCHPQSPMRGDPSLVEPLLYRLRTAINTAIRNKDQKQIYSFGSRQVMRTYKILLTARPDLLSKGLRTEAEKSFRLIADNIIKRCPQFQQPDATGSWVNGDIRFAEALLWAGLLLNNNHYRQVGIGGLDYIARSFLRDGGFLYAGNTNETFTYHEETIESLANFHRFFDLPLAKDLIVKSQPYFPLSIEPDGVAEYTTAACWKPYWNASTGSLGAMIVADYTNCPLNKYVAELYTTQSTLFAASHFRPDLKGKVHDNYITFDHNIEGPRGRFGSFSFSGTAREYGSEYRGKGSFAGCMVIGPKKTKGRPWNLNAALHEAGVEIRTSPASKGYTRHSHHSSHGGNHYYSISYDDKNGVAVSEKSAALGTVYRLSRYKSKHPPQPCRGEQTWLFTPSRLVGLLEITPEADIQAYSLSATFKLVSGRHTWGERKVLEGKGGRYRYGKLNLVIHESTFPDTIIRYEDTYSGSAEKTGRLTLLDEQGAKHKEEKFNLYKKGVSRYVLVEVYPDGQQPAKSVQLSENQHGTRRLTIQEMNGKSYQVHHNTTEEPQTIEIKIEKSLTLFDNGHTHRSKWLRGLGPKENPSFRALTRGTHTITLPRYGVVLTTSKD